MNINVPLGQDEKVITQYTFSYSPLLFFLKSHFWLTNKRVIVYAPNVLWIIPTGADTVTYPLRNIQSVQTRNKLNFILLGLGVMLILVGLSNFPNYFIFLLVGILFIVNSFQAVIAVTSGVTVTPYRLVPWEASIAKKLINELNQALVEV